MLIALDCRPLQDDSLGRGIGSYLLNLLEQWASPDQLLLVFVAGKTIPDLPVLRNFKVLVYSPTPMPWRVPAHFANFLRSHQVDIFHFSGQYNVFPLPMPYTVTVHDIMYFPLRKLEISKEISFWKRLWWTLDLAWMTHRGRRELGLATGLIAVSQFTKEDLQKHLKIPSEKISIVYNGVDSDFIHAPSPVPSLLKRFNIPSKFILTVAPFEERKNLRTMIKACLALKEGIPLVIVTKKYPAPPADIQALLDNNPEKIHLLTGISKPDLVSLYRLATVFLFATNYEGFGLPVLEAMAVGTPVITSTVTSLPEVAGDAALLVDPSDQDEMAQGLNVLIHNSQKRQNYIAKGLERIKLFSYQNAALETHRFFEEIVFSDLNSTSKRRKPDFHKTF